MPIVSKGKARNAFRMLSNVWTFFQFNTKDQNKAVSEMCVFQPLWLWVLQEWQKVISTSCPHSGGSFYEHVLCPETMSNHFLLARFWKVWGAPLSRSNEYASAHHAANSGCRNDVPSLLKGLFRGWLETDMSDVPSLLPYMLKRRTHWSK